MRILILASNPRKDLNLDDEIRLLRSVIDQSRDRDHFEVVSEPGVRVGDLQRLLLRHKPEIVHFCGHGGGEEGLIFKMDGGGEQWVRADALADLFGLDPIRSHVKCVLLNACYSEKQADAIVSRIHYVVGMSHEIQDNAAIAFSKGFYLALGEGVSIDDAFEFGRNAIQLEISGSSKMRSAATEEGVRKAEVVNAIQQTAIPEHLKPILKCNPTLTQAANPVLSGSDQPLSQTKREEIQLNVAKALTEEKSEEELDVKQFRDQVRDFLKDHKLADYEKDLLNALREELGLSTEEADKILEEEQESLQEARQWYAKRLVALTKYYPFNEEIKAELKKFQNQRNLTDEEVDEISRPILEKAQADYQEKLRQRERQEYEQAIDTQPFSLESTIQENLDITFEIALTTEEMSAGTEKHIVTEQGGITVKIPAGVGFGKQIRVRGKGRFDSRTQQRGNLYLTIVQDNSLSLRVQPKPLDDLRSEKGIDYTELENLLESGRWTEADKETMRVLLRVADRSQQGWVRLEDCVRLPCPDLYTINQLWERYSAQRFGFKVQKNIWDDISRSTESRYVIRDFCRACGSAQARKGAIGWWSGDKVLSIEEIYERVNRIGTPDALSNEEFNNIPMGLLPALAHWSWLEKGKGTNCLAAFFARIDDCNL